MKNVEKKELLKVFDEVIKNDRKEELLRLIKNGIVDERMCQSIHWEVHEELAKNGCFVDVLIDDKNEYNRYQAYKWLIKYNKLDQLHVDLVIQQDKLDILLPLIENRIVDKRMCQSRHLKVREELAANGYFTEVFTNDNNRYIRNTAYVWLFLNNKLEQKHIDKLLFNKDYEILQFLVKSNYENKLIDKEKISQKIKEFQEESKDNVALLIDNKNILKNNS